METNITEATEHKKLWKLQKLNSFACPSQGLSFVGIAHFISFMLYIFETFYDILCVNVCYGGSWRLALLAEHVCVCNGIQAESEFEWDSRL